MKIKKRNKQQILDQIAKLEETEPWTKRERKLCKLLFQALDLIGDQLEGTNKEFMLLPIHWRRAILIVQAEELAKDYEVIDEN